MVRRQREPSANPVAIQALFAVVVACAVAWGMWLEIGGKSIEDPLPWWVYVVAGGLAVLGVVVGVVTHRKGR